MKQTHFGTYLSIVIVLTLSVLWSGCRSEPKPEDKPAYMRTADDDAKLQRRQRRSLLRDRIDGRRKAHIQPEHELGQAYLNGLEKIRLNSDSAVSCRRATDIQGSYDTSNCSAAQLKAEQDAEKE